MSKVFIEIESPGFYILSDVVCTSGGFEIVGRFIEWEIKRDIQTQALEHTPEHIDLELINVRRDLLLHISKANYCKQKKRFEIHVETVYDANDVKHQLRYSCAKKEEFKFIRGEETEIEVAILIYNSDPDVEEVLYEICGKVSDQCLEYPRPEDACDDELLLKNEKKRIILDREIDCNSPGFDPKRKKGNILVGG